MARFTDPLIFAAALGAAAVLPAQAARPMTTDDAPVLDLRECEAQAAIGREARTDAGETALELGCGIGWQTQVNLAATRLREGADHGNAWSLAGKTALWGHGGEGLALTVSYGAARLRANGQGDTTTWITGIATWPLGDKVALHTNLGWQRESASRLNSTFIGTGVEVGAAERLDATAEVFHVDRDAGPWLQLGVRYALLPERWNVNASVARQAASGHAVRWTLGTLLRF